MVGQGAVTYVVSVVVFSVQYVQNPVCTFAYGDDVRCVLRSGGFDDFVFVAQQKGVDMRVGVDIASLAYKKQVDQIILIAGGGFCIDFYYLLHHQQYGV